VRADEDLAVDLFKLQLGPFDFDMVRPTRRLFDEHLARGEGTPNGSARGVSVATSG
jgi:hypothetical protein